MAAIWESIYSFFSPPASRDSSPQGSPSFFSSAFFSSNTEPTTPKTDLPMPPTSAFGAARAPAPSPADSSTSLAVSDRDYFSPTSPYTHRSPSMSSTSTASTTTTTTPLDNNNNNNNNSTNPAPTTSIPTGGGVDPRPAGPRRSATDVVALDTMSREFPKPAHEPSLDELLARTPGKWSLGHYVKNARERKVAVAAAGVPSREETEAEERARKFDEVKRDLMRAKEEMMRRGI